VARLITSLGLNPEQLAALLHLRARLTWRQYIREPGRIVGVVLLAVLVLPLVGAATIGSFLGYTRLPEPWPAQLLGGVLVALWAIWLLAPVLLFSTNEGLDLTRLLVYPVARRDLVVSFILGTAFDFPTYFMLPLFAAILFAWGWTPGLPLVLLALALAYGHMVLTSQIVVTVAGGILRSRRFRDVSLIIISLLGSSCWLIQNSIERLTQDVALDIQQLEGWRPLEILQWFPPGAAAQAIARVHAGAWGEALLWLGYALFLLVIVSWVWSRLLTRWLTGEGFLIRGRSRQESQKEKSRGTTAAPRRLVAAPAGIPSETWSLMIKELKALWRVPQRRVGLIQAMLLPLLFGGFSLLQGGGAELQSALTVLVLPGFAFFMFWVGGQNMLGFEGPGLPALLVTPVSRRRIFIGKGLALMLVQGGLLSLVALLLGLWIGRALVLPALLIALAIGLAVLGVSAVLSVYFPVPVNLEQTSRRSMRSTGGGCLTGLVMGLVAPALNALASLPAAIPLALALLFDRDWIAWIAGPAALAYGALVFYGGTRLAGTLLSQREPEVIKSTQLPAGEQQA
jgi:ABC-2 type transport system permease protein